MEFKHWVDNRDIRDKFYKGPLIVPYDETKGRHIKKTKLEALYDIKEILEHDLIGLKFNYNECKKFLKDKERVSENLKFDEFYQQEFYEIMKNQIENGFKFHVIGISEPLTTDMLKEFWKSQIIEFSFDCRRPFDMGFNLRAHVSLSESTFKDIYYKHKNEIGWLWDKKKEYGPYNDLEEIEEAYQNCKSRLKELENYGV